MRKRFLVYWGNPQQVVSDIVLIPILGFLFVGLWWDTPISLICSLIGTVYYREWKELPR